MKDFPLASGSSAEMKEQVAKKYGRFFS